MILEKAGGQILIECPNTIFHLYIKSETGSVEDRDLYEQYPYHRAAGT